MSTEQTLLERYVTEYPDEIARHAEELNADGRAALLTQLPAEPGASVLQRNAPAMACDGLRRMPRDAAAAVLLALPLDLGAALLRRLEPDVAEPLLAALPPDRAVPMRQVLSYRQDTAGAVAANISEIFGTFFSFRRRATSSAEAAYSGGKSI
jgi:Mg/Co/Ni transporter MgtE